MQLYYSHFTRRKKTEPWKVKYVPKVTHLEGKEQTREVDMDTLTSEKCPYSPLPRRASRGRQSHGALEDTTSSCDQSMERRGEQERRKRRGNATAS